MSRLTEIAVARRSVAILVTLAVIVAGVVSWSSLKQELIPNIELPIVAIVASQPGAGATDVTNGVTAPIEAAVGGVPGLDELQSTTSTGLSLTVAQFAFGTDVAATRDKIDQALRGLALPAGVTPQIVNFNFNDQPIVTFAVQGTNGTDAEQLDTLVRSDILPAVRAVEGVGTVDLTGGETGRLVITVDPAKLAAAGLTLEQLSSVLQANNLSLPAGQVVDGGQTIPVSAVHHLGSIAEIEGLLVGARTATPAASSLASAAPPSSIAPAAPTPVFLRDVATVAPARVSASGFSRYDGRSALTLSVTKTSDANTVEVAHGVLAAIDEAQARLGGKLSVATVVDTSTFVTDSRDGLLREGGAGAVFAVLTIFLFLLSLRSTFVAAVSIPLSILAAIVIMDVAGISMNILTLGGLAVAVGRVVDDSIVVLENIYRHRSRGDAIGDAVISGTREVAAAITSSTLTTIAVFLPLGFVGGIVSQFFLPFALTVTFALAASLIVALTVIPVLAYYLVDRVPLRVRDGVVRDTIWQRAYTPLLRAALRSRLTKWATLAIAFGLFIASSTLVGRLPTQFLDSGSAKTLTVRVTPPPGTASAAVVDRVVQAEGVLRANGAVLHIQSTVPGDTESSVQSLSSAFSGGSANSARILVTLKDDAVLADEQERLNTSLAPVGSDGYRIEVGQQNFGGGSGLSAIITGDDPAKVHAAAEAVFGAIRDVPSLINVKSDLAADAPEIQVDVDPNKALASGSTAGQIGGEVRAALVPQRLSRVQLADAAPVDLYLQLGGGAATTPDQLAQLPVGARHVPLGSIATIDRAPQQATITRIDQSLAATVTGDITARDQGAVSREVQHRIDALETAGKLDGVDVTLGGVTAQQASSFAGLFAAMGVAILLVYLVMVLVFNSLIDPFVILFSLPLATIGAFIALFVTGRAIGISSLIGFLMLIGIVVTNAIVLLDLVEQLRRRGMPLHEALIEGGRTRVRPILMTAIATIFALLPVGLGLEEGSIIAADLGTVVIGGLLSSTFLTLIVIPVVYSLVEGGKDSIDRRRERRRARREPDRVAV